MRHFDRTWADLVTDRVLSVIDGHGDNNCEAARKLGIGREAIRSWRHNGKCPDLYSVAAVARVYRVDANWLLGID